MDLGRGSTTMSGVRLRHRVPGSSRLRWGAVGLVGVLLIAELVGFGWRQSQLRRSHDAVEATAQSIPDPPVTTPTSVAPPALTAPTSVAVSASPIAVPVVTPQVVTYTLPAGTGIVLTAHGACYVEARPSQSGPVTYQGTLTAGQTKSFTSPVWLRFGDPTKVVANAGAVVVELPAKGPGDLVIRSS